MPDHDPPRRSFAPDSPDDDGLVPDPAFWGVDDRTPRRARHRRPSLAEQARAAGHDANVRPVLAVLAVVAIAAALVSSRGPATTHAAPVTAPATRPRRSGTRTATPAVTTDARVVVHVAGAVTHPGVVALPATARVVDALDAAGGALVDANLDQLNLAAKLRDGEQVFVPHGTAPTTTTTRLPGTTSPATTPTSG